MAELDALFFPDGGDNFLLAALAAKLRPPAGRADAHRGRVRV
jgi:hypothetical protein